eukprot:scaffold111283_cov29-Tisochrysis_lutea.AAC.3
MRDGPCGPGSAAPDPRPLRVWVRVLEAQLLLLRRGRGRGSLTGLPQSGEFEAPSPLAPIITIGSASTIYKPHKARVADLENVREKTSEDSAGSAKMRSGMFAVLRVCSWP